MTVYLVPVGTRRFQLYVEVPVETLAGHSGGEHRGWLGRQVHRVRVMLAEAEQARLRRERGEPDETSGIWQAILRRVAEAIAEQRLLWHLRHQTEVTLQHPDEMEGPAALACVKSDLGGDVTRHLRWMIIDVILVAITGPLFFFVPGPNVVSWYFTFRAVGHFWAWRGARRGLNDVQWRCQASAPLSDVRRALDLDPDSRRHRLLELGSMLGLSHLAGFVERVFARAK